MPNTEQEYPTAHIEITEENSEAIMQFAYSDPEGMTVGEISFVQRREGGGWITCKARVADAIRIVMTPKTYDVFGKAFGLRKKRGG